MDIKTIERIACDNALATETFNDGYREYVFSSEELLAFANAIGKECLDTLYINGYDDARAVLEEYLK